LSIKPDFAEAHNNLGLIFVKQGRTDKAIRHFSEALRIKPDLINSKKNLEAALILKERMTYNP